MKKELENLHSFAPLCHECFRKVVEGKEKGVKPLSLTPCILINNKDQKIIRESFPQYQIVCGNTKGIAYKRQEIIGHIAVVHKPAQGADLALFHFLANVFHDIPAFLVIQVNIGIP